MVFIILIIIACCAIYFSHFSKNSEGEKYWRTLFRHITDTILKYHTGTPTKVVLYALYGIIALSGAVTFSIPLMKAIVERNEETGFWKIFIECQWESLNLWIGGIAILAIVVIVGAYLYTYKYYSTQDKDIDEIKQNTKKTLELSKSSDSKLDEILSILGKHPSNDIKQLLPRFKDDIHALKVKTAYAHLQDINSLLEQNSEQDKSLLATIQYYMGMCARYFKSDACKQHFELAYSLMLESNVKLPEVLEGMVYISCKAKQEEQAHTYANELKSICPTNIWTAVPDLIFASDIDGAYNSIPVDINKSLVLANSMLIGWGKDQIFIDLSTHDYIELDNITIVNFSLWILNLNVAMNKFMQSMHIRNNVTSMYTTEAQKVYELTDKYISLLAKTEIQNLIPDTIFLHAFTGYLKNQKTEWLEIMHQEKGKVQLKEFYYLGYAIMLRDKSQYPEATQLLKDYGKNAPSSILNMRLLIAFQIGNTVEMVDVIREATENQSDIPDHLLPNFFAVVKNLYAEVKLYASSLVIQNPLSKGLYDQFLLFEEKQDVDMSFLQKNEEHFNPVLLPYLAIIYKERLGLGKGIELLNKCVDNHVLDFRAYTLINFYREDSKYAKDLYHLLRDLRNAGEIDDNLLWLELQMAETIQDYSIGLEISTQLIARHPDDFQTLVYHIKVLRGLERVEEIKSYKQRINEFNLQKVYPYLVHVIVNIFISINEILFAIEFLYNSIKQSSNQELKDFFYTLSLNSSISEIVLNPKEKIEEGDYVEIKKEEIIENVEITSGSVYSDLVGHRVNEEVELQFSKPTVVSVESIHNKYYKLMEDVRNDIMQQKSRNIKVFSINDYNFEEDPIGAIQQMIGTPPDREKRQEASLLNYKKGELSLSSFIHDYDEVASLYNLIFDKNFSIYTLPNESFKKVFVGENNINNFECVLDLSSLILLQQIDLRFGLAYDKKFIIPVSLQSLLKDSKIKEETSTPSFIHQSVIDVVKIHNEDSTKTPLWNLIVNLLSWIDIHCEVQIVEDRLNAGNTIQKPILSMQSDSIFIASHGKLLITEDKVWQTKMFNAFPSMSVTNWLYLYGYDFADQYATLMLECGNLGGPIKSEYIYEQYDALVNNQANSYSLCIANIELNPFIYPEVLKAGDKILLKYNTPESISAVTNMFVVLFKSMPQDTVLLLCYKETLIPHASAYVSCLQEAFKIAYPIIT